jgi:hypothetical protein
MQKLFSFGLMAIVALSPAFTVKTATAAESYITSANIGYLTSATAADAPAWIFAPAIGLLAPIEGVGTNAKGEMDVPSGYTNNVGWYQYGVRPGEQGTAVLDAHVFAAFKNLDKLPIGSDIYIYMSSGRLLHYVTKASQFYALSTLSPYTLFAPTTSKQLNLITCAGSLTWDGSTYSHRLIVSAELV